jgi:hypothetical protein
MDEPIKVVADILQSELVLKPDQVLIYNQKFDIPPDDRLYLSLAVMGSRTFGASTRYVADPVSQDLNETQNVNRQEMYSLMLYSRSAQARVRNWEVPAALVSTFAQQMQEKNSIKISQVPTSMLDISEVDGTARLNKYSLTFMVLAAYTKTKPTQYFDRFSEPEIITNP